MIVCKLQESLEQTCKEHNTKLTDWEVSYETLKKKSKSREDELLSLLEEVNNKNKNKNIGMHKEISYFLDHIFECKYSYMYSYLTKKIVHN